MDAPRPVLLRRGLRKAGRARRRWTLSVEDFVLLALVCIVGLGFARILFVLAFTQSTCAAQWGAYGSVMFGRMGRVGMWEVMIWVCGLCSVYGLVVLIRGVAARSHWMLGLFRVVSVALLAALAYVYFLMSPPFMPKAQDHLILDIANWRNWKNIETIPASALRVEDEWTPIDTACIDVDTLTVTYPSGKRSLSPRDLRPVLLSGERGRLYRMLADTERAYRIAPEHEALARDMSFVVKPSHTGYASPVVITHLQAERDARPGYRQRP